MEDHVQDDRYTFGIRLDAPFATVRESVEAALKSEGFGILTEIDVAATLLAKLGVERDPYVILGACNPPLAHRAITADPSVGALLPCNVVVRTDGDRTVVEAMDPRAAMGLIDEKCPSGMLLDRATEVALRLASIPPGAFALTKEAFYSLIDEAEISAVAEEARAKLVRVVEMVEKRFETAGA